MFGLVGRAPGAPFADVAIICAILGTVLGLVPSLHRAFFFDEEDGHPLERDSKFTPNHEDLQRCKQRAEVTDTGSQPRVG
jgi:hypothetical protein